MVQLRAEARILSALRFEIISLRNSAWVAKVNEYNMQSKGNASKDSESRSEQPASKTQQAAEPLKPDSPQAWISSTVNDSYPRFQQDHDDMLQCKLYSLFSSICGGCINNGSRCLEVKRKRRTFSLCVGQSLRRAGLTWHLIGRRASHMFRLTNCQPMPRQHDHLCQR
jgi:hypothetical protein